MQDFVWIRHFLFCRPESVFVNIFKPRRMRDTEATLGIFGLAGRASEGASETKISKPPVRERRCDQPPRGHDVA